MTSFAAALMVCLASPAPAQSNPDLAGMGDNTWLRITPQPSQRFIPRSFTASDVLESQRDPVGRSYSGIHYGDGKILSFGGGHGSHPGNDVEIYDIANNLWTQQYKPEVCSRNDAT